MVKRISLSCGLLATVVAAGAAAAQQRFVRLFNGKDLTGFKIASRLADRDQALNTWKVVDGVITCSGRPEGYLVTEKRFRSYVIRFDWRYPRPAGLMNDADFRGNSGLLVHITGDLVVWPKCVEVQLENRDAGNIFGLSGAKAKGMKDAAAQSRAIKPPGQWNSEEVTCQDGSITCRINGELVCSATEVDLKEGPIGWQSEGAEIQFRNIQIQER
jgi:hypothetical protein